jgi:PKD repeat protein
VPSSAIKIHIYSRNILQMGLTEMSLNNNDSLVSRMGNAISIMLVAMLVMSSIPMGVEGRANENEIFAAPTVLSTTPVDTANGVAINAGITVVFDESMDTTGVNEPTVIQTSAAPTATFTFAGWSTTNVADDTATFTHVVGTDWNDFQAVTVRVTGGQNTGAEGYVDNYQWTFTVGDFTAPTSAADVVGAYWRNTTPITITATASDLGGGAVASVALYYRYGAVNGTFGAWTLSSTDLVTPWSFSFAFASGQGYYEFYTIATDTAVPANVEAAPATADVRYGYDNVAPTSACDVVGAYWRNTTPITITATASDATSGVFSVALYCRYGAVNGTFGAWTLSSTDLATPWSFSFAFASGQGYYEFYTIAVDRATNTEAAPAAADVRYGYDTGLPTSAADVVGAYWRNVSPITITATASDALSGVYSVALWHRYGAVNGTFNAWALSSTDLATPWSYSYAFASGQGYYEYYSIAVDRATNTEAAPATADVRYGYDSTAPTSACDVVGAYRRNTTPITITATASDALSGVYSVALYYRYGAVNGTFGAWTLSSTDTATPWSFSFAFASGQGYYEFYTIATDFATNVEAAPATADVRYAYDNVAPVSACDVAGAYWRNAATTITVTASDVTGTVVSVALWYRYGAVNGTFGAWALFGTDVATPWSFSFTFPSGQGYYEFYSIATDNAGNVELAPATADLRHGYDTTAPTSAADVIGAYWRNTTPITITATATDALSGFGSVALYYRYGAVNGTFGAWTLSSTDLATPWSFSFAFASGQGYYEFYTIGTDRATNVEAAPATPDVRYGYDSVAPISSVDAITPYWQTSSIIAITATAQDVHSGLRNVSLFYRYSPDGSTWTGWALFGTDTAFPWYWAFEFLDGVGIYEFYTIASDKLANVEDAPTTKDAECGYADIQKPTILSTAPSHGTTGVSLSQSITVTFSEAMDIGSISYSCNPSVIGGWSAPVWSGGYTIVTYTPIIGFIDSTTYTFQITAGTDAAGNALATGAVPNPWNFMTKDVTAPVAEAGQSQTVGEGTVVTFVGSGSTDNVGIVSYVWTFTDNGIPILLSGITQVYQFNYVDVITVTLTVTDVAGNSATDTMTVTVKDVMVPVANAGPDQTVNQGDSVTFDGSASTDGEGITDYSWCFTDGVLVTLSGVGPTHLFNTPGVYLVTLTVEDAAGNIATDMMAVIVLDVTNPISEAGQDQAVSEGTVVTFVGGGSTDNVGIVSYVWTFTDNGIPILLSGITQVYQFNYVDLITVTLTVTDAAGNSATDTMIVTVLDTTVPIANAGADQIINQGDSVTFDGSASTDGEGITDYSWCFTDGVLVTLSGVGPSHIFNTPGVYLVTLTVEDAAGNIATDTMTVTVLDVSNPMSDAGLDQVVGQGTVVIFNGLGSNDNVGIVSYVWTFGNVTLSGATPSYLFTTVGFYNVTLTVRDAAGNEDTDIVRIQVTDATSPIANAGPDQIVIEDATMSFNGSGSFDIVGVANYTWTFIDGTSKTLYTAKPGYQFNTPGVYLVTLTVSDAAGNMATDTVTVMVKDVTPPFIKTIVSADDETDVALNVYVVVTWSEAMNPAVGTVIISPAPIITGTWTWSVGNVYTYSGATWRENQLYTLTFTGFTDVNQVAAIGDLVKNFTTLATPPTITDTQPLNSATDVVATADIVITFSEPMNPSSVIFTITPNPGGLIPVWSADNTVLTIIPNPFTENTDYTFEITDGTDANGVPLAGTVSNLFSTIEIAPTISITVPDDGTTDIVTNAYVVVTWSEAMTVIGTVTISPTPITAGTWAWSSGNTVYTYSGATWAENTLYTLTFTGFIDANGVPASGDLVKTFKTGDFTVPTTTVSLSGTLVNGWYTSAVTVGLHVADGVSSGTITYYSLNEGRTWKNGTSFSTSFSITSNGENILYYYTVDNAGNSEQIKTVRICIDNEVPFAYISSVPRYSGATISIYYTVFENYSGINFVELWMDTPYDTNGEYLYGIYYSSPITLTLDSGDYNITVRATDKVGNGQTSIKYQSISISTSNNPATTGDLDGKIDPLTEENRVNLDNLENDITDGLNLLGILVFFCILMMALIFVFALRSIVMMNTTVKGLNVNSKPEIEDVSPVAPIIAPVTQAPPPSTGNKDFGPGKIRMG